MATAAQHAAAANIAYQDLQSLPPATDLGSLNTALNGFSMQRYFGARDGSLQAYALTNGIDTIIVFRGSQEAWGFYDDGVNLGYRQWEIAARDGMLDYINQVGQTTNLSFAGHSLGGALAQYAAYAAVAADNGISADDIGLYTFSGLGGTAALEAAYGDDYNEHLLDDVVGAHYFNYFDAVPSLGGGHVGARSA